MVRLTRKSRAAAIEVVDLLDATEELNKISSEVEDISDYEEEEAEFEEENNPNKRCKGRKIKTRGRVARKAAKKARRTVGVIESDDDNAQPYDKRQAKKAKKKKEKEAKGLSDEGWEGGGDVQLVDRNGEFEPEQQEMFTEEELANKVREREKAFQSAKTAALQTQGDGTVMDMDIDVNVNEHDNSNSKAETHETRVGSAGSGGTCALDALENGLDSSHVDEVENEVKGDEGAVSSSSAIVKSELMDTAVAPEKKPKPTTKCDTCGKFIAIPLNMSIDDAIDVHEFSNCQALIYEEEVEEYNIDVAKEEGNLADPNKFQREAHVVLKCNKVIPHYWQAIAVREIIERYMQSLVPANPLVDDKRSQHNMLLCDEMGLGKTLTALMIALFIHRSPTYHTRFNGLELQSSGLFLVICPLATLAEVWARQIKTFTGFKRNIFVYQGNNRESRLVKDIKKYTDIRVTVEKDGSYSVSYPAHDPTKVLFILTTAETISSECSAVHRKKNKENKWKKKALIKEKDSLLFTLCYSLVIYDEVHKAKRGPKVDEELDPEEDLNPANKKKGQDVQQDPSNRWSVLRYMTYTLKQRVLGLTGTPIANRTADIANLAMAFCFPDKYTNPIWWSRRSTLEARQNFNGEYTLRRTGKSVGMSLAPAEILDETVPIADELPDILRAYSANIDSIPKLAGAMSQMGKRARFSAGHRRKFMYAKAKYQMALTSLRIIAAAPLTWYLSLFLMTLNKIRSAMKFICKLTEANIRGETEVADDVSDVDLGLDSDEEERDLEKVPLFQQAKQSKERAKLEKRRRRINDDDDDDDDDVDSLGNIKGFIVDDLNGFFDDDDDDEVDDEERAAREQALLDENLTPAQARAKKRLLDKEFDPNDEDGDLVFDIQKQMQLTIERAQNLIPSRDELSLILEDEGMEHLTRLASNAELQQLATAITELDFQNDMDEAKKILKKLREIHSRVERNQERILMHVKIDMAMKDHKMLKVLDIIDQFKSEGPLVICSCFLRTLYVLQALLNERGIGCRVFSGVLDVNARAEMLTAFDQGDFEVLLLSQRCGGEGISLVKSNRMIMTDLDLSPSTTDQVMARIHRYGQKRTSYIHRLAVKNTIEAYVRDVLLKQKKANINRMLQVVDGNNEQVDADNDPDARVEVAALSKGVVSEWALGRVDGNPEPAGNIIDGMMAAGGIPEMLQEMLGPMEGANFNALHIPLAALAGRPIANADVDANAEDGNQDEAMQEMVAAMEG